MPDPRITKLAQVLTHYSLGLARGEQFCLVTSPLANELSLAVFKEAILSGAHVTVFNELPGWEPIFYEYASSEQLDFIPPARRMVVEQFDARLIISAPTNTRELTDVDPERISRVYKARKDLAKTFWERSASGAFKWCDTVFPTAALAQEADMSLGAYQDFVYSAGRLDDADPIASWQRESHRQQVFVDWLAGKEQVRISGANIDIEFSINSRSFGVYDGKFNFPDGEIATSPVESSVNGWVRFSYPGIYSGQEVSDIELWFDQGKVVKEQAAKGQHLLTGILNTDAGARYLGEWGIGTNYGITRFTKNMLFDEKMGGTIHLALGAGLPQAGGQNESSIHWDMLCDMWDSEIIVDGELFYKDGKFVI